MADRKQDHPQYQGVKGVKKDFGDTLKKEYRNMGFGSGGDVGFGILITGVLGGLGGMLGGLVFDKTIDTQATQDLAISYNLEEPENYQALRFDDRTIALVHNNGSFKVYHDQEGELVLRNGAGDALQTTHDVVQYLNGMVTAMEDGSLPDGDIADFIKFDGLSVAHNDDGQIERDYDEQSILPAANQNFLETAKQSLAHWEKAQASLTSSPYGFTEEQAQSLEQERHHKYFTRRGAVLGASLIPFLFLGAFPVASAAARVSGRRRRTKNSNTPNI